MRVRLAAWALPALILLLCAHGTAAECPALPTTTRFDLPRTRAAIKEAEPIEIIAFGSSSTLGYQASSSAAAYPAVLQTRLTAALPQTRWTVINRGINGEDAPEALARLSRDVIAHRPRLVIWQVGANDALRGTDASLFRTQVLEGIRRLRAADIDVILMGNQRAPRIAAAPHPVAIDAALRSLAAETGVGLFSRGELMDFWSTLPNGGPAVIAQDGLHHNDLGYRCVADALATRIVQSVSVKTPD